MHSSRDREMSNLHEWNAVRERICSADGPIELDLKTVPEIQGIDKDKEYELAVELKVVDSMHKPQVEFIVRVMMHLLRAQGMTLDTGRQYYIYNTHLSLTCLHDRKDQCNNVPDCHDRFRQSKTEDMV